MTARKNRSKINKRKTVIWILIILGLCAMEFPGILFLSDKIYPFILGVPFLYGYMFCCWIYMCLVMFYAYKTSWGRHHFFKSYSK